MQTRIAGVTKQLLIYNKFLQNRFTFRGMDVLKEAQRRLRELDSKQD